MKRATEVLTPKPHRQLRAYGVAACLCGAIAAVDYRLLAAIPDSSASIPFSQYVFYAVFIAQLAALAVATGNQLHDIRGRWLFFGWCLILINLLLLSLQAPGSNSFKFAFHSSQFAFLCIWCLLGCSPWTWRLAAGLMIGPFLLSWSGGRGMGDGWSVIFLFQCAVALAVSGTGRWLGYRLIHVSTSVETEPEPAIRFGIRDIMVWMLALGPALLILKSLSWLELLQLRWKEFGIAAIVGFACMTTTIAALYATLGQSVTWRSLPGWLVRFLLLVGLPLFVGFCLWFGFEVRARQAGPLVWGFGQNVSGLVIWLGRTWMPWMVFSSLFLSSLLLCFRTDGQRLVRIGR